MEYVDFKGMAEVYKYLISPASMGLYSPSRGLYVDVYNEEGALASYPVVWEEAKKAERNRRFKYESSWAPFLNRGYIYEDNGSLDESNALLSLCQQIKDEKNQWIYAENILDGEQNYHVTMSINATYEVDVTAPSKEEAKEFAMEIAMVADFGVAENIDAKISHVD